MPVQTMHAYKNISSQGHSSGSN